MHVPSFPLHLFSCIAFWFFFLSNELFEYFLKSHLNVPPPFFCFVYFLDVRCDKISRQKQLEGEEVYFGLEFQRNGVTIAGRPDSSVRTWRQWEGVATTGGHGHNRRTWWQREAVVSGEGRWLFTLHPCSGSRELIGSGARLLNLKARPSGSLPPARGHLLKDLQHSKTASPAREQVLTHMSQWGTGHI